MTSEEIWSYLWRFLFYMSLLNEQLLPAALKYSRAEYPKSWKSAAKMAWMWSSRWQGTWVHRWRYSWLGLPSRWRATTPPGSLGWIAGMKLCLTCIKSSPWSHSRKGKKGSRILFQAWIFKSKDPVVIDNAWSTHGGQTVPVRVCATWCMDTYRVE